MNYELFETKRLILQKITVEDYLYLFKNKSVPEIMSILGLRTEEEFLKEKSKFENGYKTRIDSFVQFQLIEKSSDKIIGGCSLHNWYPEHRRAELGYGLFDDSDKGNGFMSEAVGEIITYGFERMNLHRIEAYVAPDNIPSLKLMSKFSFTQEGVLREHYFFNEKFDDSLVFSLLKADKTINSNVPGQQK